MLKFKFYSISIFIFCIFIHVSSGLDYNQKQIPNTPNGTLIAGVVFTEDDALIAGSSHLYLSPDGYLNLEYLGNIVWKSDPPPSSYGSPFTMVLANSQLNIRDRLNFTVWQSQTFGLGGTLITLFEDDAYNRQYGLVMLNSKAKMVWGKLGKLINSRKEPPIPGTFIDLNDPNNRALRGGEFITNGRDYLFMGKNGVLMLFTGNPNGDSNGAASVFASTQPGYPVYDDWVVNLEPGGTMVFYSSYQNPFVYRIPTHPSVRYLHLPDYKQTFSKGEWSLLGRSDNGTIVWGQFSDPSDSSNQAGIFSQDNPRSTWSLTGSFVKLWFHDYNPTPTTSAVDLNLTATYLTPDLDLRFTTLSGTYNAVYDNNHNVRIELGFRFLGSGNFQGYVKTSTTYYFLYETPVPDNSISYSNNYYILFNQVPAALMLDCNRREYCGLDRCGCKYIWAETYTRFYLTK